MTIENYNYLHTPNFRLTTKKCPNVEFFATNLTWPAVMIGNISIPTPRGTHNEPGVGLQYSELSVDFLVDTNLNNYFELYKWMRECAVPPSRHTPYTGPNGSFHPFSDMTVSVLDNSGNVSFSVVFVNAFPVTLGNLPFDVSVDQPVPIRCPVSFRFDHFERPEDPVYD